MPRIPLLIALAALGLPGCAVLQPVAAVATHPLDKKGTFQDVQQRYTANIRYGLYDEAVPFVEPELQLRFKREIVRLRELRFSDYVIENLEIDPLRTEATVVVKYRGYWLSSPFEREIVAVQRWRRRVPSQTWYVTPDFDALLEPGAG